MTVAEATDAAPWPGRAGRGHGSTGRRARGSAPARGPARRAPSSAMAAATPTIVLPVPVTASTTPRPPWRRHAASASSCHWYSSSPAVALRRAAGGAPASERRRWTTSGPARRRRRGTDADDGARTRRTSAAVIDTRPAARSASRISLIVRPGADVRDRGDDLVQLASSAAARGCRRCPAVVVGEVDDDLAGGDVGQVRRVEAAQVPLVDPRPHVLAHPVRRQPLQPLDVGRVPPERVGVDLLAAWCRCGRARRGRAAAGGSARARSPACRSRPGPPAARARWSASCAAASGSARGRSCRRAPAPRSRRRSSARRRSARPGSSRSPRTQRATSA